MSTERRISNNMLLSGAAALTLVLAVLMLPMIELDPETPVAAQEPEDLDTFESEEAFVAYLESVEEDATAVGQATDQTAEYDRAMDDAAEELETPDADIAEQDRVVGDGEATTVQVAGVDEPDFVKTDGDTLYYSADRWSHDFNTTVVSDLPDMELAENLSERGDLLIDRNTETLVILEQDTVTAYDISGDDLEQVWTEELDHGVQTARMVDGQLVLVLSDQIDRAGPCPIRPMAGVSVGCTSIYRPGFGVQVDSTYSVIQLDADTGDVDGETAFVGSPQSTVYMSGSNVYVAYTESEKRSDVMMDFLLNHASIDDEVRDHLETVDGHDLSDPARTAEIEVTMEQWLADDEDRAETVEDEIEQYIEDRKRDIETTTIVRIDSDMEPAGEAMLPGRITDRMHLHEHRDELAALTRIDVRGFPADRTNDLTLFDADMDHVDTVEDVTEDRFPDARFIGDRMYLTGDDELNVHALDDGSVETRFDTAYEYIHALDEDRVLGIGQVRTERDIEEELAEAESDREREFIERRLHHRNVSVSILDVTREETVENRVLDESGTSINYDFHAFQHDAEQEQFFLPVRGASYIGDYGDGLVLDDVNASGASRAFFIGDHLYTIGTSDIRAFDAAHDRVSTLTLPERDYREPVPMPEPAVEDDVPQ